MSLLFKCGVCVCVPVCPSLPRETSCVKLSASVSFPPLWCLVPGRRTDSFSILHFFGHFDFDFGFFGILNLKDDDHDERFYCAAFFVTRHFLLKLSQVVRGPVAVHPFISGAVPFWGQNTRNLSDLSTKGDRCPKRVKTGPRNYSSCNPFF